MAVLRCKMCGGDLNLIADASTAECEFCGSVQTIPKVDNEKKLTLFARANRLRIACEFDKAAGVYESIVADFPEEAESYWGLVLCKYGIEYVDDPATGKKIPTCHRSSFDSIMEDSDFEQALENADIMARRIYREEAKTIEEIRKGIISVSAHEEPYDIFICYKETAENGDRTLDSVLAQDVYDALTDKGYRVFFSRITLEDKLGVEYEPYIFAALNSAKIMLVFGTDYEHFNAVWVKNEWSRYLKLMAKDKGKHLIPCFKGIDAYDMPKEFARLQAQDLGKVGAVQDLLRGIEKLLPRQTSTPVAEQKTTTATGAMVMRGQFALDDGDWAKADEFFERALDENPEDSKAYVGKVLVSLQLSNIDQIDNHFVQLEGNKDFDRAIRFATGADKTKLEAIKENSYKKWLVTRLTSGLWRVYRNKKAEEARIAREAQLEQERLEREIRLEQERLAQQIQLEQERLARLERAKTLAPIRQKLKPLQNLLCIGNKYTVALNADGSVSATGYNRFNQCNVADWSDIVAISAGDDHSVGLKRNGTVVATGAQRDGKCDVRYWHNIVGVWASENHTVGLRANGTVVATGSNTNNQCDVSGWTDIVSVCVCDDRTIGLKKDGTVVAAGFRNSGACNVETWTDIIAVCGVGHTVGLKKDGTVVATGPNSLGACNVSQWTDIISICTGRSYTVGLKADGSVVATKFPDKTYHDEGQCNVSQWTDIVSICAGSSHTVGLKANGTVVAVGKNQEGQCNVSGWTNIVAIYAGPSSTLGIRADGTVVATGANSNGECNTRGWQLFYNYELLDQEREAARLARAKQENQLLDDLRIARQKLQPAQQMLSAGTNHTACVNAECIAMAVGGGINYGQCNVSGWGEITAISTGEMHTIGLKSDGTVVTAGTNVFNQRDVSGWKDIIGISATSTYNVGLKSDGTVVTAGMSNNDIKYYVSIWKDITAVSAGSDHTVGLKSDGTVVAAGKNDAGQCNVSHWKDIVTISAGRNHTVGLKADGTVVAVGKHDDGQCKVSDWREIVAISAGSDYTIALKKDGTVVAAGKNDMGQCKVTGWRNIVAISAGWNHTVGLKTNGTLVSTGDNRTGKCNVSGWKLFKHIETLEAEKEEHQKRVEEASIARQRRVSGKCQHCGGEFKGFLSKKCVTCGKPKDY